MRSSLLVLLLLAGTADAKPKPPKAHVECMSGMPVKSGVAAKLDPSLFCSIHIDSLGDFKLASLTATLLLIPADSTSGVHSDPKFGPPADTQDGIVFELQDPWRADKDYRACEAFKVNATLDDADHPGMDSTLWKSTFKVAATCPRPKKVAGALRCNYTAQDGTVFKWPGNGAKVKPRMESTFSCTISAGKPEAGVVYAVSLGVVGKPAKTGKFETEQAGNMFFAASFDEPDYGACSNFAIAGDVKASGATLWSGKLAVKQDCPD